LHNTVLGIFESLSLQTVFFAIIKPFAGRYRPRYLEIVEQASSDPHQLADGRSSYPSGHSSSAFSVLFFCSLYILGKSRVYSRSSRFGGGSAGRFGYIIFSAIPILIAFLVAVTRTRDYMHNFSDINAGAMIGIICSTLTYFNVFPALTDPMCQLPRIRLAESSTIRSKTKVEDEQSPLTEPLTKSDSSASSFELDKVSGSGDQVDSV